MSYVSPLPISMERLRGSVRLKVMVSPLASCAMS
jgi:hypothetical protein